MKTFKDFLVESFANSRICEMADDRKQFANMIENLFPQIVENICLIVYAKENKVSEMYVDHWLIELTAHIDNLRRRKLKLTKSRIFKDTLDKINYDIYSIQKMISNKFNKEHFDVNEMSYDSYKKILYFLDNSLSNICCKNYSNNDKMSFDRISETKDLIIEAFEISFEKDYF